MKQLSNCRYLGWWQKKSVQTWTMVSVILMIAIIMTIPAFASDYFSISWDGRIHLARFQQIQLALKSHRLPPLVSFIGFGQQLSVLTGMYPWLTAVVFFFPGLWLDNPMSALKLGFLVVNFLTGLTAWRLMRFLTTNRYYQGLGVTLYMVNMYHLILLYARVDMGEILAYTFLPLVLLGCLMIWRNQAKGWCWLAFGMIGIANSHVLSLLIVTSLLILVEVIRLVKRRVTRQECYGFLMAGVVAIMGSIYSLGNIVYIVMHNQLLSPAQYLLPIPPQMALDTLLTAGINERFDTWNIGIVLSGLLLVQLMTIFIKRQVETAAWSKWTGIGLALIVFPASWWPFHLLVKTPMALMQFPGRLLSVAVLVLTVAAVFYFKALKVKPSIVVGIQIVALLMAVQSIHEYATAPQRADTNQGRVQLVANNYQHEIMYNTVLGPDYLPKTAKLEVPKGMKISVSTVGDDQITTNVRVPKSGVYRLPMAYYQGVQYVIHLNGQVVTNMADDQFQLKLRRGQNRLTVHSSAPKFDYVLMGISVLTILGCLGYVFTKRRLD